MSENLVKISSPTPQAVAPAPVAATYPTEVISLPSKGWFYPPNHPLAKDGKLELKMMTAKEEDILLSKNLMKKGVVLDKLLESLIVDKAIDAKQLLVCDRNAAFIAIRRLAYGDKYKALIECGRCEKENEVVIDLSKFDNKPFDFEKYPRGQNAFNFVLPKSGVKVTYKLLTQEDDNKIEAEVAELEKLYGDVSKEVTTRLKHTIIAVDGDPKRVRHFVDNELRAADSLAFRVHLRKEMPDVDITFDFACEKCGASRKEIMPIGQQFFWPSE